jgi:Family of unknown function (DUF5689)
MKKLNFLVSLTATGLLFLSSCLKQKFDNPPQLSNFDPNLQVTMKIRDLVSPFWGITTNKYKVCGDDVIYGIVTADDRSGNFYKQIVMQDSTGGINIVMNNTALYGTYPIGRKLYIKLKNLTVMSYKGLPQLCYYYDSSATQKPVGIPASLQDSFIVPASYPNTVTPKELRITDLNGFPDPYYNMLVQLDNMQFDSSIVGLPYALPSSSAISTSRTLWGCNNGTLSSSIVLYNSGFADFFSATLPSGYGTITGIYTVYGSTNQFQIRDTTDVNFTQSRCHR